MVDTKAPPKTVAERQKAHALRQKERGLVKVWAWAYPEDRQAIREFAEELRRKRESSN